MLELTIGMAVYQDFDGVYFTTQALRLYQEMSNVEILIVDNFGCDTTAAMVAACGPKSNVRYVRYTEKGGTAAPRQKIFEEARGSAVLCVDSHILLAPGVVEKLKAFYREHPASNDLYQGPLVHDDFMRSTHFQPEWGGQMFGRWGYDARCERGEPFEIPMQGLGAFSCRKSAWLGFNPRFRGFGGEEFYIHEKFRQAGRACYCLPWLGWMHRFGRPNGVPYHLTNEDKLWNYLVGWSELGLPLDGVYDHFLETMPGSVFAR
ncbi:MAG: glycosyltransferase, partial [Planctomycetota bacterium]